MWMGRVGHVTNATHRVELDSPATSLIPSAPYRAGLKATDFEKNEIDNMLSINVVETAETEWAFPIVLDPKKDGNL